MMDASSGDQSYAATPIAPIIIVTGNGSGSRAGLRRGELGLGEQKVAEGPVVTLLARAAGGLGDLFVTLRFLAKIFVRLGNLGFVVARFGGVEAELPLLVGGEAGKLYLRHPHAAAREARIRDRARPGQRAAR